jgi:hypothetical protein
VLDRKAHVITISLESASFWYIEMREPLSPGEGEASLAFRSVGGPDAGELTASLVEEVEIGDSGPTSGPDISLEEDHRSDEGGHQNSIEEIARRHPLLWNPAPSIWVIEFLQQLLRA